MGDAAVLGAQCCFSHEVKLVGEHSSDLRVTGVLLLQTLPCCMRPSETNALKHINEHISSVEFARLPLILGFYHLTAVLEGDGGGMECQRNESFGRQ